MGKNFERFVRNVLRELHDVVFNLSSSQTRTRVVFELMKVTGYYQSTNKHKFSSKFRTSSKLMSCISRQLPSSFDRGFTV